MPATIPTSAKAGHALPCTPKSPAVSFRRTLAGPTLALGVFTLFLATTGFAADVTNSPALPLTLPQLPNAGPSVLRVMGALALVLGLFLGGVWLFRNWQRLTIQRGRPAQLNVIETRSLGGKHALYVIGYQQERFLLASSPAGVNLLSHLPSAEEKDAPAEAKTTALAPSFAQALAHVLKGK
jgi:flagellar biogenesis protein FliO